MIMNTRNAADARDGLDDIDIESIMAIDVTNLNALPGTGTTNRSSKKSSKTKVLALTLAKVCIAALVFATCRAVSGGTNQAYYGNELMEGNLVASAPESDSERRLNTKAPKTTTPPASKAPKTPPATKTPKVDGLVAEAFMLNSKAPKSKAPKTTTPPASKTPKAPLIEVRIANLVTPSPTAPPTQAKSSKSKRSRGKSSKGKSSKGKSSKK